MFQKQQQNGFQQKQQEESGIQFYATQLGTYDEMQTKQGKPLPHWEFLMQALDEMGSENLERRRQEAHRILQETGVTYNVYDDPNETTRPWELDPVPLLISNDEWLNIESGLAQRAELLNLILKDIYGPQTLIKKRLIPYELVYAHLGFIRACVNFEYPGAKQLILHSANMARGPDGQMWVMDDRTQAPSGAGYALENRTVMTRTFPGLIRDAQIHRLASFFRGFREGLAGLATHNVDDPHVVVLTPGPYNETYFEHAYLASYLGYTLAQGDDLTVRDGKVWIKSIDGLRQVDVILRRVDDTYCDPLALRSESRLGVAGLLEAVRLGNVALANPIGSSVLENPALFAFLPGIAKHFLGEELKLPSVATWWCGQEKERKFVLNNLNKMVIKSINRSANSHTIFGEKLSKSEIENLSRLIEAKPHMFVGQQQVSFSTAPSLVAGKIEPRHAVIRTFSVAKGNNYSIMPGGLTRIAAEKDSYAISYQSGGVSKDTWVTAQEPEKHISLWLQPQNNQTIKSLTGALPSRAADNLFWVGRYVERAEGAARLLRSVLLKLREAREIKDPNDVKCLHYMLRALTHVTASYPGFTGKDAEIKLENPREELLALARDPKHEGSIASTLQAFSYSAFTVRDLWSLDTWRMVDEIQSNWRSTAMERKISISALQSGLDELIMNLLAFSGLTMESMVHESGWVLLDTGRRIERALHTISLIRTTLVPRHDPAVESQILEAVLATSESVITFRRRYRAFMQLPNVLELLLMDEKHPRALAYQLNQIQQHISALPKDSHIQQLREDQRLILEAYTNIRLADSVNLAKYDDDDGIYTNLDELLETTTDLLWKLSDTIIQTYFSHIQSLNLQSSTPIALEDVI